MKQAISFLLVIVSFALLFASCTDGSTSEVTPTTSTPSDTAPEDDLSILVEGNTEFAFDLYQKLKDANANFFISPYSISTALAMTYAGARGETEQQMADALHFTLPQERLHVSFYNLDTLLKQRGKAEIYVGEPGEELTKETVDGFRLNIANAIWGQEGYSFLQQYIETIMTYYGCGLRYLDFINDPEAARLEINDWASNQTEGRINNLLGPGSLSALVRLVLANATYFKANWAHEFNKSMTTDGDFTLLDGSTVTVPMMQQRHQFSYAEGDTYQAIRLPYLSDELAMTILLPRDGEFESFENSLDSQILQDILAKMESREVDLSLPKFTFESSYRLNEVLSEMGMPAAFSGGADFSGMTGNQDLFIGSALHKTFVSVDEVGTEAAAVTVIIMMGSAPSPPPTVVSFTADRPFIFLIQDIETGSILFMGRVLNPIA
jgi:serpin B